MSVIVVTGTGTDVGKTVATAAIAGCLASTGESVAVVKPIQTGVRDGAPGDLAEVERLVGKIDTYEFARYPDPLSPHHAAQVSGRPYLTKLEAFAQLDDLVDRYDRVIVEGAGGLLVPMAANPAPKAGSIEDFIAELRSSDLASMLSSVADEWTMIDLLNEFEVEDVVVVVGAGLGTLNHTQLTVDRLREEGFEEPYVVIGSWPRKPGLAERCNLVDLSRMSEGGRLAGVLPHGLPDVPDFTEAARAAISPRFAGTFDAPAFVRQQRVST